MGGFLFIIIFSIICAIIGHIWDDEMRLGAFFGFIFSILILIFLAIIVPTNAINEYQEVQYEIQGLENKNLTEYNASGMFILGCGGFSGNNNNSIKYYYFRTNEYGKKLESIDGTNIYIKETNEQKPCLIHVYETLQIEDGFFRWFFGDETTNHLKEKILVVPENTIKIDYNVDI